ncbi:thiamine pyrophosphate-dependent dehydrogenase E1 component subunit alpha [Plantactinospora sp. KBS50]|uniref:thiamine pyrophosphate-dependent dehydrogenase E1 component subunit alpha n=1 Tax=Plantactinospora sp. KBS50 TaxID=2024580 RepID=UPI000BAB1A7E|nr:thiamine pyrophosphate-dependent dehydrogenase E1 component subunit alpha [Plantactinospora sp. KBS50]ASW56790.1 ABC transporter substrate-binding protein [Plantactinospora sp. KBS50]
MTSPPSTKSSHEPSIAEVYRVLRTIREFEERVHEEFPKGEIPGAVHLYAGQEAVAAGVCAQLRPDDYIASTHRGHGHAIAKGCDITAMMLELYGKAGGLCGGKGGSMHIADFDRGMLGANGVAAGGVPLALGAALSAKVRGSGQVAVAFVGDGGVNQGAFAESLTLAAVWRLPVVFVVEDNGYAQATGTAFHLGGMDVAARATAQGIPARVVDGYDVFAVRAAAADAVRRARDGHGPALLECRAQRFFGHMEGWDQQAYRGAGEVDRIRAEHDCIQLFLDRVTAEQQLDAAQIAAIDASVRQDVERAVAAARSAPDPDVDSLLTDVYVNY